MSEENVDGVVVRQQVTVGEGRTHRLIEERIALRFPQVLALLTRAVMRLSPGSRLRQVVLRRAIQLACEATNREDYEAAFALIASSPDYEAVPGPELVALGFDAVYRGREGRVRYHRTWVEELGSFRLVPGHVIDQGDRLLVLARLKGTGASSGAEFDDEVGMLFTIGGGQVLREQHFRSHKQALEAAGLSE